MKTVDILIEARALIVAGWTRGVLHNNYGGKDRFCSLGALDAVGYSNGVPIVNAERYLRRVVGGNDGVRIAEWNDDKKTSKKDVLLAFDRAIKNARRRHING